MKRTSVLIAALLTLNALVIGTVLVEDDTLAAPPAVRQPFENAVQQRADMLRELQEIRDLLKEQNNLLKQQQKQT